MSYRIRFERKRDITTKVTLLATAALVAAAAAPAAAVTTPAWEFTGPVTGFSNNAWNFGTRFTAQSFRVTALGYFDANQDGFSSDHEVALYDASGTLLRSATVTSAAALIGNFRYVNVAPLVLTGTSQIQATSGTDNYTWNTTNFATASGVALVGNYWELGNSPVFLSTPQNDVRDGYWGGNLLGAAVPEPASWAMLIIGFGAVGATARRRRVAALQA